VKDKAKVRGEKKIGGGGGAHQLNSMEQNVWLVH